MEYKQIKSLKNIVEEILIKFPETRNSDTQLTFRIIYEKMPEEMIKKDNKWFISTDALKIFREDNVKRLRAKLNEKGKYLPTDPEILKKRGINEENWRSSLGYSPELRKAYD